MDRAQVHRERVAEPLAFVRDRRAASAVDSSPVADTARPSTTTRLAGQPEPVQRLSRAGPAFERGAEQVGAQPALDVGAGPDAQQVQRDQLRGVAQCLGALVAERTGHGGPDRAEHLVAGAHGDRHPRHREGVLAVRDRAR